MRKFKPEDFEKEKLLKKARKVLSTRGRPTSVLNLICEIFDRHFGKKWRRNDKLWREAFRLAWRFAQISRSKKSGIKSKYDKGWGAKVYWLDGRSKYA